MLAHDQNVLNQNELHVELMLQATLSLYLQNIVQRYPTFVQGCFTLKTLVYQIQLMSLFQLE